MTFWLGINIEPVLCIVNMGSRVETGRIIPKVGTVSPWYFLYYLIWSHAHFLIVFNFSPITLNKVMIENQSTQVSISLSILEEGFPPRIQCQCISEIISKLAPRVRVYITVALNHEHRWLAALSLARKQLPSKPSWSELQSHFYLFKAHKCQHSAS